jgi:carbon-monoxide dehydrogenase medium subunit
MLRPELLQPCTLEEALRALSRPGAVALAGATDLIPAMRRGEVAPRALVSLRQLPHLTSIRATRSGVMIGACVTVADLLTNDTIAQHLPLLAEVARDFGSPQIRATATVGGNLCRAIPSADLPLPLLVLDARIQVIGPSGAREIPVAGFFRGVGKTALHRGEFATAILAPRSPVRFGASWAKLTGRKAMDVAIAAAAASVAVKPDGLTCRQARIALGAVAARPTRAPRAEAVLEGATLNRRLIGEAARLAAMECQPISDLRASAEYRREMIAVLARRALTEACRRAGAKL